MSQVSLALSMPGRDWRRYTTPLFSEVTAVNAEFGRSPPDRILYTLAMTLKCVATIDEKNFCKGDRPTIIQDARTCILEALFGEFREYFHRIRQALYHNDYYDAHKLINDFENQMFLHQEPDDS